MDTRPQLYRVKIGDVSVAIHGVPMVEVVDAPSASARWTIRGDHASEFQRHVALALIHAGVHDADSFRRVRQALGLKGFRAAELLDVRPETVSAWENGKTPVDRKAYAVLSAMLRERMGDPQTTEEHLEKMAAPALAAVELDWKTAAERQQAVAWRQAG